MRWDELYIAGTATWFPGSVDVEAAVAEGRYDIDEARRSQQLSVTVAAAGQRSPEMAVMAARRALRTAMQAPEDVGLLLYAVLMHAGVELWNSASYIQPQVATEICLISEIRSGCNGALVGLELACSWLRTRPDQPAALVVAADQWPDPVFDRWRADSGLVFGDGASAVVLSREHGFARLLAMCTTTDPELEGLHRGDEEFGAFRHSAENPIDLYRRAQGFLRTMDRTEVWERNARGLRSAADQATAEAGVPVADIDHVVLPFFGRTLLMRQCLEPLNIDLEHTTWDFGRRIGHTGAGDQFAGLHHLVESGRLAAGQRILLVGVGGGFTWTCAVLEVT